MSFVLLSVKDLEIEDGERRSAIAVVYLVRTPQDFFWMGLELSQFRLTLRCSRAFRLKKDTSPSMTRFGLRPPERRSQRLRNYSIYLDSIERFPIQYGPVGDSQGTAQKDGDGRPVFWSGGWSGEQVPDSRRAAVGEREGGDTGSRTT
jgi:hypothetical protein